MAADGGCVTMPRSSPATHGPMAQFLVEANLGESPRILDCGMGAGLIGRAVRGRLPKADITGIEIWKPYLFDAETARRIKADTEPYDSIVVGRAGEMFSWLHRCSPGDYSVVIFGDCLEHFAPEKALALLRQGLKIASRAVIVNTPVVMLPQGDVYGNPHERHQFAWARAEWERLGGRHLGGSKKVACFAWEKPTSTPELTVVIATLNRFEVLNLCLRCLLMSQAAKDKWEILVIDDGSSDGTPERVSRDFPNENIRVIARKQHVAVGRCPAIARNVGIKNARGKVIAFVDDDILHLTDPVIPTLAAGVKRSSYRLNGYWSMLRPELKANRWVSRKMLLPPHAWWATSKELLLEIGGYDERFRYFAEDGDIVLRLDRLAIPRLVVAEEMYAVHAFTRGNWCPGGKRGGDILAPDLKLQQTDNSIVRNVDKDWGTFIEGEM